MNGEPRVNPDRPKDNGQVVRVGPLRIHLDRKDVLLADGTRPKLAPKVLELLLYLAERADQVVSKEQLMNDLWAGRVVENNALNQVIFQTRLALDDPDHQRLVTFPKRGFLLQADKFEPVVIKTEAVPSSADAEDDLTFTAANEAQFPTPEQRFEEIISATPSVTAAEQVIKASKRQQSMRAPWLLLGALLVLLMGVAWFWQYRAGLSTANAPGLANNNESTPVFASAAELANADVILSPEFSPELLALFKAAARGAGKRVVVGQAPKQLSGTQFALALSPGLEGVLLQDAKEGEFYPQPYALSAFVGQMTPGTGKVTESPFQADPNAQSLLEPLFKVGTSYQSVFAQLEQGLTQRPFSEALWADAAMLMKLAGRSSNAALLKQWSKTAMPNSANVVWLDQQISQARQFLDQANEAKRIASACANVRIQSGSWMHGACLIEQAMAERRANQTDAMLASLALATQAFKNAGDTHNLKVVEEINRISFKPSLDDVSALAGFEDGRALGVLMRPMVMTNPSLAHASATKVATLSWVKMDLINNFEALQSIANAARRLDDRQKMADISTLFEAELPTAKGSLRIAVLDVLMNLYYARGLLGKAAQARALMDDGVVEVKPISRCRSAVIFLEAGRFELSRADAEACLNSRFERSLYAQFAGTYGWTAKIADARLNRTSAEANSLFDQATAEFETMLADETVEANGHQAISSGTVYLSEAWALDRWDWIERFCVKHPEMCAQDFMRQVVLTKRHPEQLEAIDLPEPGQALSAPELLTMLYIEQTRLGRCPIMPNVLAAHVQHFKANGSVVSLRTLEKMQSDCLPGQRSSTLDQFYKRITY